MASSSSKTLAGARSESTPPGGVEPVQPMAATVSFRGVGATMAASAVPRVQPFQTGYFSARTDIVTEFGEVLEGIRVHGAVAGDLDEGRRHKVVRRGSGDGGTNRYGEQDGGQNELAKVHTCALPRILCRGQKISLARD